MEPVTRSVEQEVQRHYGTTGLFDTILDALRQNGRDVNHLGPQDLIPVEELHVRGREGTADLAGRIQWQPGWRVLDVGCGIGGSTRYLATTYDVDVTGVDLTQEFVDTASRLSELVGLDGNVHFYKESALDLPFRDESFDVVWTQHVQMNIQDKRQFYGEMVRVLKPGGKLLFHDVFQNGTQEPYFPMPWADDPSYSFLTTPENVRRILEGLGLKIQTWDDTTQVSRDWQSKMAEMAAQATGPVLSLATIFGEHLVPRMQNAGRSLQEGKLRTVIAVAEKPTK